MITPKLGIVFIYFSSKLRVLEPRVLCRWEGVPDAVHNTAGQRHPAAHTQDVPNPPHELAVRSVPVAAEIEKPVAAVAARPGKAHCFVRNKPSISRVFSLLFEKLF